MDNPVDVVQKYFNAWNAHDADSIANIFTEEGEYHDPSVKIRGRDIHTYVQTIWEAFPDLSFEIVSQTESGEGMIAAQWLMKGTNTGSFQGLPPSGREVLLPGADFIKVSGDKIESVTGYFDSKVVPEQLGLQLLVQPSDIGPFSFGNSVCIQTSKPQKPGAFSITSIWNSSEDTEEIKNQSGEIAKELLQMDGFIGSAISRAGSRGITITAWEKPEDVRQIMQSPSHNRLMKRFWDDLGDAGYTSVWVPHHFNPLWVRCKECKKMNDYEKTDGLCACGRQLPDPPPYF